jgi:hypothetical protein
MCINADSLYSNAVFSDIMGHARRPPGLFDAANIQQAVPQYKRVNDMGCGKNPQREGCFLL